jgi:hypothetical protein
MKVDPYAVAGAEGTVAFIAPQASGVDALFRYSDGELSCAARVGDRTENGHSLTMMHFGSAEMTPEGDVAFIGRVRDSVASQTTHLAVLLGERHGALREIAVEGARTPSGASYSSNFSLPAAVSTPNGAIVAFTAKTNHGTGFYLYHGGKTLQVMATGDRTAFGPLTYLSDGRPGLSSAGVAAVRGQSGRTRAIFEIRGGRTNLIACEGNQTEIGSRVTAFGDPGVSASGRVFFGIMDEDDRSLLYAVTPADVIRISSERPTPEGSLIAGMSPSVFAGTLVVNENGAYAFLGGR